MAPKRRDGFYRVRLNVVLNQSLSNYNQKNEFALFSINMKTIAIVILVFHVFKISIEH